MSAVDLACPPERMQGSDEGPPWALESVDVSRQLDNEFVDAVACVVRLQIDLNVDRATLLRVLKCLSQGKVDNAKGLVPKFANWGGAHGRIEFLSYMFDPRVVKEVHDLLVQPTQMRRGHAHAVLKLLERELQKKRGVDMEAMLQRCCAEGPRPARLTGAGTILHWILQCAPPATRAAGYIAYKEEKAALAGAGLSPLGLLTMQVRGAGSTSSSNATGSEAGSHLGSPASATSSKRHCRASELEPADEGATAGACVAGSSDS